MATETLEAIKIELPVLNVRILKEANCPSLSKKSILTYHLGTADNEILIRVFGNTGNGIFSKEWVLLKELLKLIDEHDGPFTWTALLPRFQHSSVNTACFLMAALKNEGLVKTVEQGYEYVSSASLTVKALIKKRGQKR